MVSAVVMKMPALADALKTCCFVADVLERLAGCEPSEVRPESLASHLVQLGREGGRVWSQNDVRQGPQP